MRPPGMERQVPQFRMRSLRHEDKLKLVWVRCASVEGSLTWMEIGLVQILGLARGKKDSGGKNYVDVVARTGRGIVLRLAGLIPLL